jgi:hypothetical protein
MRRLLLAAAVTTALAVPSAAAGDASQATQVVVPRGQGVSCTITLDPATGNRLNDPTALSRCATDTD